MVIATATQGGSFSAFAQALKEAIAEVDPELQIDLLSTRGSAENLPMLMAGKVDLGMVEGTLLHERTAGRDGAPLGLSVITALFPSPGMFVVRADSNYRKIADLRGKRVVFGAAGSGFVVLARYVLDGLGLDQMRDFDAVLLQKASDGPALVLNGEAVALWGGGAGWPAFEAVATGPLGGRFLGLDDEEVAQVRSKHPFLRPMTVRAHTYPGLDNELKTVGSWSWLLARPDLPKDLAARLAGALQRAQQGLQRRFPAAEATPEASRQAMPVGMDFHPGVAGWTPDRGTPP